MSKSLEKLKKELSASNCTPCEKANLSRLLDEVVSSFVEVISNLEEEVELEKSHFYRQVEPQTADAYIIESNFSQLSKSTKVEIAIGLVDEGIISDEDAQKIAHGVKND